MSRTIRRVIQTKPKGHTKPELRKSNRNAQRSELTMLIRTAK